MLAAILLLPLLALSSAACSPRVATHGFMPRDELINQLSQKKEIYKISEWTKNFINENLSGTIRLFDNGETTFTPFEREIINA